MQRSTVVAWLNLAYTATLGTPFEEVPQQDDPANTLTDLVQLLAFADALGSSRGLLLSLDARVTSLRVLVQLGETSEPLASRCPYFKSKTSPSLAFFARGDTFLSRTTAQAANPDQLEVAVQQLAQQVESLLYLACKLQLKNIQQLVVTFIFNNSYSEASMLRGVPMTGMLSERVLATAAGAHVIHEALASRLSSCVLSLEQPDTNRGSSSSSTAFGLPQLQLDVEPADDFYMLAPIKFTATLREDFVFFDKGQQVQVEMDLCGGSVTLSAEGRVTQWGEDYTPATCLQLPMQVLLGAPVKQ